MRTIKRYPNRKLYDTERKRYVTLDEIAAMIQEGMDVQVVDHESGADLTSITLAQIIFEREKKRSGFLPQSILTSLVRTGGGTVDYIRRSLQTSVKALRTLEEEIDQRIDSLVARGELAHEEAERLRKELHENASAIARELMPDLRLDSALERLNLPSSKDVERLQKQVEQLSEQVELLLQHTQATNSETQHAADERSSSSKTD